MNNQLATVTDIHVRPDFPQGNPPRADLQRTVRCDVVELFEDSVGTNPTLQLFFHHGQTVEEDTKIAILLDQLLEAIVAARTNALNRAADRGQVRLDELVERASMPDPDAPDCDECGGGLAHFPECSVHDRAPAPVETWPAIAELIETPEAAPV